MKIEDAIGFERLQSIKGQWGWAGPRRSALTESSPVHFSEWREGSLRWVHSNQPARDSIKCSTTARVGSVSRSPGAQGDALLLPAMRPAR